MRPWPTSLRESAILSAGDHPRESRRFGFGEAEIITLECDKSRSNWRESLREFHGEFQRELDRVQRSLENYERPSPALALILVVVLALVCLYP